jgi:biotin operon repressor
VGPVQHQHAMALGALDRHETRARPGDRIADRLGVSRTSCPGAEIFRAR